ncbi:Hsp70 nucleotide exchange factor fes1 [Westerdykella ornata]|uniref:Hsp70 nucleotide exchange factor fes1 n=1 Tax=Westerdykella ornata TaxID=318751 RepID=A0A6A6JG74_WESOR|nr:Hsp70 nucleotide exchange factor fes1 [Westerdykella ornata]KAF2274209.1 Hsp70 nucleotide exchange factor fes1 [Westerdykella ornata]
MNDPRLNNLLKWSIENSEASRSDPNAPKTDPSRTLDADALRALLTGMTGPSDAEMMLRKMDIIMSDQHSLEDKVSAFDDFEMLIENLDNANNMENLGLWTKLIDQLEHEEAEIRKYAAWCAGTAVENNARAQERLLVVGAIPTLVKLAIEDPSREVRKKAVRALSCASRNHQPSLDALLEHVPSQYRPEAKLDAGDMAAVDSLIHRLKADAEKPR